MTVTLPAIAPPAASSSSSSLSSEEVSISLPPGSLGLGIRKHDRSGLCFVHSTYENDDDGSGSGNSNADDPRGPPLRRYDVVLSLNGIVLADVEGDVDAWVRLFRGFESSTRNVKVLRAVPAAAAAAGAVAGVDAPSAPAAAVDAPRVIDLCSPETRREKSSLRPQVARPAAVGRVEQVVAATAPASSAAGTQVQPVTSNHQSNASSITVFDAILCANRPWTSAPGAYKVGVLQSILSLRERSGSSLQKIKQRMQSTLPPNKSWINNIFLKAVKSLVSDGDLTQVKGKYKLSAGFRQRMADSQRRKRDGSGGGGGANQKRQSDGRVTVVTRMLKQDATRAGNTDRDVMAGGAG